ncbi:MAG: DUF3325 domain-containing protein [Ottowia sp.]|uniref:DUF3325 domain-containing protein n=1 Tax=Ottowia sp. TaxID=1898956 RepID=UPI003C78929A
MNMLHASFLAWLLSFGGMAALAFAMDRHYEQLTGRREVPARRRAALRCAGALLLAGVVPPSVLGWSASVGAVATLGFWSLGALAAAGLMSWSPRYTARVAVAASLLGICLGIVFSSKV